MHSYNIGIRTEHPCSGPVLEQRMREGSEGDEYWS